MSSSDAELSHPDIEAGYLPFDPEAECWADVAPTFQDDGAADVLCGIMYDPAYSSAMDLFRTLHPRRELSPRTLALTTHLVTLNPSSYSVWAYRASILMDGPEGASEEATSSASSSASLGSKTSRLQRELAWVEEMARTHKKTYQVWQHRKLILSALPSPDLEQEMDFIGTVLTQDSKNYHTWAYRQWLLLQYGGSQQQSDTSNGSTASAKVWSGELTYVQKLLQEDARNNSAWNHRFFILFGSRRAEAGPAKIGLKDDKAETSASSEKDNVARCIAIEADFVKSQLTSVPSNLSAWAYLRGILNFLSLPLDSFDLPRFIERSLLSKDVLDTTNQDLPPDAKEGEARKICIPALEYLLDVVEEQQQQGKQTSQTSETQSRVERIVKLLTREDPVRAQWWDVRKAEILTVST